MKIELHEITIREVTEGYRDSAENGVVGYAGRLNIRPPFQREYIYKDKLRDGVIRSIINGFPINVMYWAKNADGGFELLDGQQRTISFCQYVNGDFSVDHRAFYNLTEAEKNRILDYPLMIYQCEGADKEKLDWFKIINIAGLVLTAQELRNAVYAGPWLADAKIYFSRRACPAYKLAEGYMNGTPIRQDYLEAALKWISSRDGAAIEDYMSAHQHDQNADGLWVYFQDVIAWAKRTFPNYRKEMKGLEWGLFFNKYGRNDYSPTELETRLLELFDDDDVQSNKGAYEYLLGGDERTLNLRAFDDKVKRKVYERQKGVCAACGQKFDLGEMEADHVTPWSQGGATTEENCQMLCRNCNRRKGDR